jgi:uncharacterized protein with von Willebrand factor type A (vWA) domain
MSRRVSWASCKNVTPSLNEASDLLDASRTLKWAQPEWRFQSLHGDSNDCVSIKNYDAFLQAYLKHEIKQLAAVTRLE